MSLTALIGAGPMAQAYAAVLKDLDTDIRVIGRGQASADKFSGATGINVRTGGLEDYLASGEAMPSHAIVSTPVDALTPNCIALMDAGVRNILVEKPAGLDPDEVDKLAAAAQSTNANVYVAYNRRFYASVLKARELIAQDGGATSLRLEFSEWTFRIKDVPTAAHIKSQWLYANSTHVLDMGFYMAGFPVEISICRPWPSQYGRIVFLSRRLGCLPALDGGGHDKGTDTDVQSAGRPQTTHTGGVCDRRH